MYYFYIISRRLGDKNFEVFFPDIQNALTWTDKIHYVSFLAEDVLNDVLKDYKILPTPSTFEQVKALAQKQFGTTGTVIVSGCSVRQDVLDLFNIEDINKPEDKMTQRINISIPGSVLQRIDEFRAQRRGTRSKLFRTAVEFYMNAKNNKTKGGSHEF